MKVCTLIVFVIVLVLGNSCGTQDKCEHRKAVALLERDLEVVSSFFSGAGVVELKDLETAMTELEELTGIKSKGQGNFVGWFPAREDLRKWEAWYSANGEHLCWDSKKEHFYLNVWGKDPVLQLNVKMLKGNIVGDVVGIRLGEKDSIQSCFVGELFDNVGSRYSVLKTIHISDWSQSRRFQSYIIVYNENRKFLGYYNVDLDTNLPDRVLDNYLVFDNVCEEPLTVSFIKGVPKFINIGCQKPSLIEFLEGEKRWLANTSYTEIKPAMK